MNLTYKSIVGIWKEALYMVKLRFVIHGEITLRVNYSLRVITGEILLEPNNLICHVFDALFGRDFRRRPDVIDDPVSSIASTL